MRRVSTCGSRSHNAATDAPRPPFAGAGTPQIAAAPPPTGSGQPRFNRVRVRGRRMHADRAGSTRGELCRCRPWSCRMRPRADCCARQAGTERTGGHVRPRTPFIAPNPASVSPRACPRPERCTLQRVRRGLGRGVLAVSAFVRRFARRTGVQASRTLVRVQTLIPKHRSRLMTTSRPSEHLVVLAQMVSGRSRPASKRSCRL